MKSERAISIDETSQDPPDGGIRAYIVMVASFLTNGLIFGVINSYSVIYDVLEKQLKDDGVQNSESSASLVGALAISSTFFLSPLSGVMTGFLGLRVTAVLGGTIATTALLLSSFLVRNVTALYFTYGIMYGLGASLAYTPSLAILGHYFKKYLGLINGIATIGSSAFTIVMPPLMEHVLVNYGLAWLFRFLAAVTVGIAICGLLFKPTLLLADKPSRKVGFLSMLKSLMNFEVWKVKKYRLWALTMPVALFGYFVPYVHIKKFIGVNFKDVNDLIPLQCIAVASAVGRILFGFVADKPGVDSIFLQQISFYVIGTLTIILPFVTSFGVLVVMALLMGIFDGGFIALIGPIAFNLCGSEYAGEGIGYLLGLAATPLSVGPPVAGYLYSLYQSYTLPFILAGASPIVGATLMFTTRFFGETDAVDAHRPVPLLASKTEENQQSAL